MTEREKVAHVLRRFALGASEAEMDYYVPLGLQGTIDRLFENAKNPPSEAVDPMAFANKQGVVNIRVAQGLWHLRLLTTTRPLLEKVTLFWHNHFATSAAKVTNAFTMMNQIDTFREFGLGSFRDLLGAASKDPAMLFWLDNNLNVKGKPNENFAREVMELFTLGIGHYSESDVQEAARAFTGWGYGFGFRSAEERAPRRRERFVFDRLKHDTGVKTILGKSANHNGDDVLDLLCAQDQTVLYLAQKAWRFFGCENPEPKLVERSAQAFRKSNLNIETLFRSIMESEEFYGPDVVRKLIKNPIDFTVPTARQLGAGQIAEARVTQALSSPQINEETGLNLGLIRALAAPFAVAQSTKAMGMELLYPPDVAGWGHGDYWINSATMVARMKWSETLFAGGAGLNRTNLGGNAGANRGAPNVGIFAFSLFQDNPTPTGVVKRLCSLFDVPLDQNLEETLGKAAEDSAGTRITAANANDVARKVTKLICGLPGYQMN